LPASATGDDACGAAGAVGSELAAVWAALFSALAVVCCDRDAFGAAATAGGRAWGRGFGGASTSGPFASIPAVERRPDPRLSSTLQSTDTDPLGSVSMRPLSLAAPVSEPPMMTGPLWASAAAGARTGERRIPRMNAQRGARARCPGEPCVDERAVRRAIPCRAFPDENRWPISGRREALCQSSSLTVARQQRALTQPRGRPCPRRPSFVRMGGACRKRLRPGAPRAAREDGDWRRVCCPSRGGRCRRRSP